jgi:two-component system, OmpR family, sensor histidine kinase CiaH
MAVGRTELLLWRTRRRLFLVTLGLLTLLVAGIGAATLVVGLNALDADVDRALQTSVTSTVASLSDEMPTSDEQNEPDEQAPAAADTVLLVIDPSGTVIQNRTGSTLTGLPDTAVLAAAASTGDDLRTITAGGHNVRLLTVPLVHDGQLTGYVQGGFVLDLHDSQSQSLVLAVIGVGAMGLIAAALITLLVTGRALIPIRDGFEAQRRFVADASHELRTPAALIRANAEVLERERLVSEDGQPLLEDVIAEADRLGGLVGDLLQLSAWDETELSIAPESVDVAQLARETVRGATALAAERGVRLETEAADAAIAVVDRTRIVQLLLILIDNAVDHSPAGGSVTVRVTRAARVIEIGVDDEGPGIPEGDRERIFEPFTRLSGTTRHGSGGTGLGLAIARRIVDAHGGTIRADSPSGGGARFTVELPGPSSSTAPSGRAAREPDVDSHSGATRSAQTRARG